MDTAGKNTKKIAQYIQNQLKEDQLTDQMTLKEYWTRLRVTSNNPMKCQTVMRLEALPVS